VKITDLFVILLITSLPPGAEFISPVKELCKMGSRPIKDLIEEQTQEYEKAFGDDTKL
jgi:hypothetical protein